MPASLPEPTGFANPATRLRRHRPGPSRLCGLSGLLVDCSHEADDRRSSRRHRDGGHVFACPFGISRFPVGDGGGDGAMARRRRGRSLPGRDGRPRERRRLRLRRRKLAASLPGTRRRGGRAAHLPGHRLLRVRRSGRHRVLDGRPSRPAHVELDIPLPLAPPPRRAGSVFPVPHRPRMAPSLPRGV